jgi:hypothetical protein
VAGTRTDGAVSANSRARRRGGRDRLVPRAPSSCRVRRAPLRCDGRVEPGPMRHSALGTSSTSGETRRGLRVSPTRFVLHGGRARCRGSRATRSDAVARRAALTRPGFRSVNFGSFFAVTPRCSSTLVSRMQRVARKSAARRGSRISGSRRHGVRLGASKQRQSAGLWRVQTR